MERDRLNDSSENTTPYAHRRRTKHHQEDILAHRPERHAYAKFTGSLSHGVGDHAVQADGGQRQRQDGKSCKQRGYQVSLCPFRLQFDPAIEIANIPERLLVRINSMNLFADSAEYREWRDPGPDEDLCPNAQHDRVWHKHGGLDGIAQAIIAGIADDAD